MKTAGLPALAVLFLAVASLLADNKSEARQLFDRALKADDVRAIELLARAHTLEPGNAQITYRMGFLYHKMNRIAEAEKYYDLTIDRDSCNERALNNIGSIYAARPDTALAAQTYRKALTCAPWSATAAYNLANLLSEEEDSSEAEKYYLQTLSIDPHHSRSHHNLGILYMTRSDRARLEQADTHLERARTISPADPLVLYNAALVKKHTGRNDLARKLLDSADRLCENRPALRKKIRDAKSKLQTR